MENARKLISTLRLFLGIKCIKTQLYFPCVFVRYIKKKINFKFRTIPIDVMLVFLLQILIYMLHPNRVLFIRNGLWSSNSHLHTLSCWIINGRYVNISSSWNWNTIYTLICTQVSLQKIEQRSYCTRRHVRYGYILFTPNTTLVSLLLKVLK